MDSVTDRLMRHVQMDPNGGCWLWSAKIAPDGYGGVRIGQKDYQAHRAVWASVNGPIPNGLIVRHKCDVRGCVNPDHLLLGTLSENSQDAINRGRHKTGQSWPRLTDEQVSFIRSRLADGWKDKRIADQLGVSRMAVSRRRRKMKEMKK